MKNTSVEIHVDILKYTQNNTLVLPSLRSLELFSPRSSSAALSVPVSERSTPSTQVRAYFPFAQ